MIASSLVGLWLALVVLPLFRGYRSPRCGPRSRRVSLLVVPVVAASCRPRHRRAQHVLVLLGIRPICSHCSPRLYPRRRRLLSSHSPGLLFPYHSCRLSPLALVLASSHLLLTVVLYPLGP